MRFNAVIAAAVLAATVSSAAIAKPAPETTEITEIEADVTPEDVEEPFYYAEEGDEDDLTKREAEADPQWVWSPKFRPPGLPVGKREADPQWVWSPKFRPPGLPVGKREADPQWVWSPKFRPPGLPVGKRE